MTLGAGQGSEAEAQRRAEATIEAALSAGINHFDHADIYQGGRAESRFGTWLACRSGLRDQLVIQSKCGIRPAADGGAAVGRYDFSSEHLERAVEGSLRRLGCDRLDVLLLHRPDALVVFDELAQTIERMINAGKVKWIGVSNQSAAQMRLFARHLGRPLVANQLEYNPVHCGLVDHGLTINRPENAIRSDACGALEECQASGTTLQAWSPLARGFLSGREVEGCLADERTRAKFPIDRVLAARRVVARLALQHQVSSEAVILAWIQRHPAAIQPVIGTTDPQRIRACAEAENCRLSREDWYELLVAGRGGPLP